MNRQRLQHAGFSVCSAEVGNNSFIGTIICVLTGGFIVVSWTLDLHAAEMNINNWAIETVARSTTENVPAYICTQDSIESGRIIEVVASPYINGLSSIVLIQDGALAFVAGNITSPGNLLVIAEIRIRNGEDSSRFLRVDDLGLANQRRQHLPYAAVAKGESHLVGKTTIAALQSSQEVSISVKPDETLKMTYCFIAPPKSLPVRLVFQNKETDCILTQADISEYSSSMDSLSMMEMAGQGQLAVPLEDIEIEGHLLTQDVDIRFQAEGYPFSKVEYPEGVPVAMYMGSSGARSFNTRKFSEKIDGTESAKNLSSFYVIDGRIFLSGTITVLRHISPFEMSTTLGKQAFHITFKGNFQAEKGDMLAGLGQAGSDASVLSVRVMGLGSEKK